MSPLEWEVRWICDNSHLYKDKVHVLVVIYNLSQRYRRQALIREINAKRNTDGVQKVRSHSGFT